MRSRRDFLLAAGTTTLGPAVSADVEMAASASLPTPVLPLDGNEWRMAIDPRNNGREEKWYRGPVAGARPARVPSVIQELFPEYHGVAWYWCEFTANSNPHPDGRHLIRFHCADYLAEVWVNGTRIGIHEGGEEPFAFDATGAVRPGADNLLAVRVLSPTHDPVDGITLETVASGRRDYPDPRDNAYSTGGIVGSVELAAVPAVRIEDLHVEPDWKSGDVRVSANLRNAGKATQKVKLGLFIAPAVGGECLGEGAVSIEAPPGDTPAVGTLHVAHHRLWELNDPCLYRVTARTGSVEQSVRCGFRDFRFQNGYFRLNGRRIRLHGPLYVVLQYPVTQIFPLDEDLLRRDVINMKAMGFNIVRVTCGAALPRQLDLLDEAGLLVCEEHFGARELKESPEMERRWDRSLGAVVKRDRNHPSIVMWSLLNEVKDGRLFRHAVESLGLVRGLDQSRLVSLGSGRFDGDSRIGSLSNPGSHEWESDLRDVHSYPGFPHSADAIREMRSGGGDKRPMLLSEYGVCGAQDYPRFLRHFEQMGREDAADARLYREKLVQFMADWKKWRLEECWLRPEDYFAESQRVQAKLAWHDYNAWMSNPAVVGDFTSTQINDAWFHGCGITNYFRELKPGMADAYNDMAAKVRLCLFAEGVNVYRGSAVRLEAALVNLDALKPGRYPVRLQVAGPKLARVFERTIEVHIPEAGGGIEPPYALPIFAEDVRIDGPAGRYRFLATFERGAAAGGGEAEFFIGDPAKMPVVSREITVFGQDAELRAFLTSKGIHFTEFVPGEAREREAILVSGNPPAEAGAAFAELHRRIAAGSFAVFLTADTLLDTPEATLLRWVPTTDGSTPPSLEKTPSWYFRADHWAKDHPAFEGLPAGGIMDYTFYRDLIPRGSVTQHSLGASRVIAGVAGPVEAICGALQTTGGHTAYRSDLVLCVQRSGRGRFMLNTLRIRENLGRVPAAEHLLRNLLNFANE